ncbi:thiamine pyrophosphokinase [Cecembia calidifontis]|uniref:Thiamine pyrophosphokinase n=1 Tax=Cecembia calidifontis TaxID=1187080 RepID=A0A4Q7P5L6_9BACT|nr:thiamine pyrophosphokinase [Cecembia calidifontis]RZS95225.1 hypothetical protein BC751_0742 [Cecembia calidifontis]
MSSHHFVKEQQEPALVILNTNGVPFDLIAPLLEWVPTVLVAQEEVYTVISWGIKIDIILADLEFQRSHYKLLEEQYPVRFLGVQHKNYLEEALQYLIASKHGAANIVGFDHQKVSELEPMLEFIDLVIWDGPVRYFPVKNGNFKKWFTACDIQLLAPEGSLIEVKNEEGIQVLKIHSDNRITLPEGNTWFHSNGLFWIGEFFNTFP